MAVALFVVRTRIPVGDEDDFNKWYNTTHAPGVLRFPGAVSARRYRIVTGDDGFDYVVLYEFQDMETLRKFLDSDLRKDLSANTLTTFGAPIEASRAIYEQVWP